MILIWERSFALIGAGQAETQRRAENDDNLLIREACDMGAVRV